jgi:uncharacterized protein DUF2735
VSENSRRPSAKIYQFPTKSVARRGASGRDIAPATDHRMQVVPTVDFGSGWYHEAAIQAEWNRKL